MKYNENRQNIRAMILLSIIITCHMLPIWFKTKPVSESKIMTLSITEPGVLGNIP
jgi:hypothetical protein